MNEKKSVSCLETYERAISRTIADNKQLYEKMGWQNAERMDKYNLAMMYRRFMEND